MSDGLTKEILERDNRELREAVENLQALINRPVSVHVQQPPAPDQQTLKKIEQYLPQLGHISTNLSHVASAVQAVNATLSRIEGLMATSEKTQVTTKPFTVPCHCDGPPHQYAPGWCPKEGPK